MNQNAEAYEEKRPLWATTARYVIDILLGAVLFSILVGLALGLGAVADALPTAFPAGGFLTISARAIEYALFVIDLGLFAFYLLTTTYKFLIALLKWDRE